MQLQFSVITHPLTTIFLWEVHNDDGNMLKKIQVNPVYRLGFMDKTSHCSINLQDTEQHLQDYK